MSEHKPTVDLGHPTPAHGRIPPFHNIEEEATFWDTHDTADFLGEFTPVELTVTAERVMNSTRRPDWTSQEDGGR